MAKLSLGKAAREAAGKSGAALPNGKYPIRNKRELQAAIKLRHHSTEPYPKVKAHILARANALGIKVKPAQLASAATEEFYGGRTSREQMRRRASSKSIKGRDPSLRWPHLYDILRAKGYDKEKAARISNSRLRYRKKGRLEGLPWKQADNKKKLKALLSSSAVVAACHSASCRPPTSGGTGGSLSIASLAKAATKGGHAARNTSAYPVDTIKTTRPGDSHPLAPGSDDRSAVRGHRGIHGTDPERRIPRQGETVDIYRDLGHGKAHKRGFPDDMAFSVRHASAMPGEQTGLVVASTTGVILNNGRPSWAHSAKAAAEVEGKRGVHGFIRGEVQEFVNPEKLTQMVKSDPAWKKVTYYPGTQDFFDPVTRDRFVGSDQVALVNGEFFAKNPQYVAGPTPISPIERKLGLVASTVVFACHEAACRPPTSGGTGGSSPKAGSSTHSADEMGSAAKAYARLTPIQKKSYNAGYAAGQRGSYDALQRADERRVSSEWKMGFFDGDGGHPKGHVFAQAMAEADRRHPIITAAEARGDSRPVSREEFHRLADIGEGKLTKFKRNASPIKGLDDNWETLKASSHTEAMKEWGGATIDAHTGEVLPQGVNRYAMTIKDKGVETVSIPQGASREEFDAAMDLAKERFRPILEREGSHLGVFHDDDLGRIDFDPVLVVDRLEDVHMIGAATRAIGGAYNFADGNGYWPPHVREGE